MSLEAIRLSNQPAYAGTTPDGYVRMPIDGFRLFLIFLSSSLRMPDGAEMMRLLQEHPLPRRGTILFRQADATAKEDVRNQQLAASVLEALGGTIKPSYHNQSSNTTPQSAQPKRMADRAVIAPARPTSTIHSEGRYLEASQHKAGQGSDQQSPSPALPQRAPERGNLSTKLLPQQPSAGDAPRMAVPTTLNDANIQQLITHVTDGVETPTTEPRGTISKKPTKRTIADMPQPTDNGNGNQSKHQVSDTDIFRRDLEATILAYESGGLRSILPPTYISLMPEARQLLRTLAAFPDHQVKYSQDSTPQGQILKIFDIVRGFEFPSYPRAASVGASSEARRHTPTASARSTTSSKRQSPISTIMRDKGSDTLDSLELPPSPRRIEIDRSAIPEGLRKMFEGLLESRTEKTLEPRIFEQFISAMTQPEEEVRFSSPVNSMANTQWIGIEDANHNRRAMLSVPRAESDEDLANGYIDIDDPTHRIRIKLHNGEVKFIRFGVKEASRIDELQTYQPTQEKAEPLYHVLNSIYLQMVHQHPNFRGSQAMSNVGLQLDYVLSALEGKPRTRQISQVRQPVTQNV